MTPALFQYFASESVGILYVEWSKGNGQATTTTTTTTSKTTTTTTATTTTTTTTTIVCILLPGGHFRCIPKLTFNHLLLSDNDNDDDAPCDHNPVTNAHNV